MLVQVMFILSTVVFWLSTMFWIMAALCFSAPGMFWYGISAMISGVIMRLLLKRG